MKDHKLAIPEPDKHFFITRELVRFLHRIEKLSDKYPVNVLVVGKQGCGKSSLVRQFAAYFNRPLATFQIGLLTEPGQLFGQYEIRGSETVYQENLFPKAITTPRCVIHLEEINRPEHPKALNELYSVLSEDRAIWIDQLGLVRVSKGVVFFATMNEGEEFVGTEFLDAALRDRFYMIHMDYLPAQIEQRLLMLKTGIREEEAALITRVINRLRNDPEDPFPISVRHSLMIAELVALGAPIREAITYSLQISRDMLESLLLSIHVETKEVAAESQDYVIFAPDGQEENQKWARI
ncbi:MAG: MoxR family ATPase [Deltaproteobacteria bacterium]|nr:MAG: MoxR family ATPase [Deltaproteobacteria bacterium]